MNDALRCLSSSADAATCTALPRASLPAGCLAASSAFTPGGTTGIISGHCKATCSQEPQTQRHDFWGRRASKADLSRAGGEQVHTWLQRLQSQP